MKILYYGSACEKEWFDKISKEKNLLPFNVAQYNFEMALLDGIAQIDNVDMKIYYLPQESYYPKGSLFKKVKKAMLNLKYSVSHMFVWNLPLAKELLMFFQGMYLTLVWALMNIGEKDKYILTPFNYPPLSLGVLIVSKLFNIKRVNIFTDLSNDILGTDRQNDMVWVKRKILPIYKNVVKKIDQSYDYYILFTKAMNDVVNPHNRPFIVMEGIYNNNLDLTYKSKEKALMYAGTLSYEYGIKNIINAFDKIEDKDLQLWLFGSGDMKKDIEELSVKNPRIKYFGFMPREDVFEYEKKASLLINIRNPNDRYTKYSFPSKTFEYMVSGTPFLTTKLEGIPDEYYNYLFTLNDFDIDVLKTKIEEIFSKDQQELDHFGEQARQFILLQKGSLNQARKIMNLITIKGEGK
ncbi:glycosyltransferase involved in cell wall biosynthesis [Paenibacillus phyllosphaerae]|uniref:Glycosyltransferase involved in cell wall biosynthesis n=1 Tax=Paenibacillus phyllosphaerae TaxID=274593 RepID=A0A7W5AY03_9BACL|nr:glycosyltransferase [Paenibacillus phyllosphaerae]MBB3110559.1 glycosyltransferase involved in cell wall biosynthesis [Paenibacillus phyllosphaerae]